MTFKKSLLKKKELINSKRSFFAHFYLHFFKLINQSIYNYVLRRKSNGRSKNCYVGQR